MELVDSGNASVFLAMPAIMELSTVVVLANFSERAQLIEADALRLYGRSSTFDDLVSTRNIMADEELRLAPYQFLWLRTAD